MFFSCGGGGGGVFHACHSFEEVGILAVSDVKVCYGIEIPVSDILASTCTNSEASFFFFFFFSVSVR